MNAIPIITVQLVHIEGPLKGDIQEFQDHEIHIGRNPGCHVLFPRDFTLVSRLHAKVVREGNRFKLIDRSTNGTFVNGQSVTETFLKSGDVIIFAEDGPKVSFLTRIEEGAVATPRPQPPPPEPAAPEAPAPQQSAPQPTAPPEPPPIQQAPQPTAPPKPPPPQPAVPPPVQAPAASADAVIRKVKVPLVVQFGPTLRSFKELPITVGRHPGCDMHLDHPELADKHAQIFFDQDQYWVRDLTGQSRVQVNGQAVGLQAQLQHDALVALCEGGPTFRFMSGGRLAEHSG